MRGFLKRLLPVLACLLLISQAALAYSILEKGDSGSDVTRMQQALNVLGYTVSADGVYGAQTVNVVKAFQRDNGLKVDGKAGNETLSLLYALQEQLAQAVSATAQPTFTPPPVISVPPIATAQPAVQTATVYCENGGKLNLRTGAGTGFQSIALIPNGTVLTLLERGSKWCSVSYGDKTGYVMTSFLRFSSAAVVTAIPQPGGQDGLQQAVVSCDDGGKLNLRKEPGSGAKVLTRIPNGTPLTVRRVDNRWYATSYNGENGYVMGSFLDLNVNVPAVTAAPVPVITAIPTVTATPAPVITALPVVTVAPSGFQSAVVYCSDGGKLNLRKAPSSSAKVLDQIPTGTPLTVERIDSKWCQTTYNGQSGYVMSKFLQFTGSVPTVTAAPTAAPVIPVITAAPAPGAQTATVYCPNGGKLNLRAGAGTDYRVVHQIPNGSALTVITRGATWSVVSYNGYTGYVSNQFLVFNNAPIVTQAPVTQAPATVSPATQPDALRYEEFRYATVRTDSGSLNVRRGPGADYAKVSEIRDGTQVVVSAIEGEWCAIYYGDTQGYAMKQYLDIAAPSGSAQPSREYDTSVFTRVLRAGYTGADVDALQARLAELGYLAAANGVYDDVTMTAVRAFQRQHGLTEDGLTGENTVAQLFSDGAMVYNSNATTGSYSSYVVDYRDNTSAAKTSAVQRAQNALRALNYNVPLTGAFEARTHDAIVAFQLRNGLTANGILDAATQRCLYSGTARDVAWPSRFYLAEDAGTGIAAPTNIQLLHWNNDVTKALSGQSAITIYDPETGLSWSLSILSRGRHLDVQPTTLEDTLIQKKSFGGTSWDIHPVYVLLPDGRWTMATMHDYPHGSNTIINNGFGGQNCVHFLRDMAEAQRNDPSYGVQNQEVLRDAWYKLSGLTVTD